MEYEINSRSNGGDIGTITLSQGTTVYQTNWIDTLGFDALQFVLFVKGSAGNITGIQFETADLVGQSDSAVDTLTPVVTNPVQFPLPLSATEYILNVGCVSKGRYVKIGATADGSAVGTVTGAYLCTMGRMSPNSYLNSALAGTSINDPAAEGTIQSTPPARTTGE